MADPKLSSINLNLLMALDALLGEGSVTRAAERLGITQSAMSHSLRQLRELLEDPLLVRGPGGMVPTPRAVEIAAPLRRGLAEVARAIEGRAGFEPASARRTFSVAMGDFFSALLLPPFLRLLAREAPGVDVRVVASDPRRDAERMEAGELDAVVGVVIEARGRLRQQRLLTEGFACLLRHGHPEARGPLTLSTYTRLSHALVSPRGGGVSFVDEALARLGASRRVALRVPYFLAAPLIVAETDLVLTAPRRIAERLAPAFGLRILEPPIELEPFGVYLVWHERDDQEPAQRWLREALVRGAREAGVIVS